MLKIWGRISSINVRKVVWCAQELGLALHRTEAGGRFGMRGSIAFSAFALMPVDRSEVTRPSGLWPA